MNTVYLLIGGNMGNRENYLATARQLIHEQCGTLRQQSAVYQTAAWGLEEQAPFLNQALEIETALTPRALLQQLLAIEESLGRTREVRYGSRVIDLDIILFDDRIISEPGLTIPHPHMQNRRFVLVPLAEIAAGVLHPVLGKTILQLLDDCPDKLAVQKFR